MDTRYRIRFLGGLQIEHAGQTISRFRTHKAAALLACLAYYRHRPHTREALIELLWPESDSSSGRASLSQELSALRHQLEPPGIATGTLLLADRHQIQFQPEGCETDVEVFEQRIQAANAVRSTLESVHLLSEAIALYRGEFLPGYDMDWCFAERMRLQEMYLNALSGLMLHHESSADLAQAMDCAHRVIAADPLQEAAHTTLIRLHALQGQTEAAKRFYRQWERILRRELNAAPPLSLHEILENVPRCPDSQPVPAPQAAAPSVEHSAAPPQARTGTITLLLIDFPEALSLREQNADLGTELLKQAHACLDEVVLSYGGQVTRKNADALCLVFPAATTALAAALAGQQALLSRVRPHAAIEIHARMALHTGESNTSDVGEETGALSHATRLLTAAHPGQILCTEATAALLSNTLPVEVSLQDLGLYRLLDSGRPERLYQCVTSGTLQRSFPPPRAARGYASRLPLRLTRFFGREDEIAHLRDLLAPTAPSPAALLTLSGPGGCGKTRLSLEVADRLIHDYAGAVWFVPLADLRDPCLLPNAIRDALGLGAGPGNPLEQAILVLARQPSLLILDNFEQLLREEEPGEPTQNEAVLVLQTLLERVPTLRCLVTSRQRLDLAGEREFPLLPLLTPEQATTPARLMEFASVQMFVDRAQAARPDFQVTPHNAHAVALLCHRLEGLPLALELAAARAQVLTPQQMALQIEHRFDFLVSRRRDAPPRHRTLHAAIHWSFEMLSPQMQRFFASLSVFRGGWTVELAQEVCAEPNALEALEHLCACSLVQAEENGGEIRFRLLESLREYGAEQLNVEARAECEARHAACFLQLAEQADSVLRGPDQAQWLTRLEIELDNLRAVLSRTIARKDTRTALKLACTLGRFWMTRGHLREGFQWLQSILALPEAEARTLERAAALRWLGFLSGNGAFLAMEQQRACFEESLSIFRELENREGAAEVLVLLAEKRPDTESARYCFEESLRLRREIGNPVWIASSLFYMGQWHFGVGEFAAAQQFYQESLDLFRKTGDVRGIATQLYRLGWTRHLLGEWEEIDRLFEESRTLFEQLKDRWNLALLAGVQGGTYLERGEFVRAEALLTESQTLFREMDMPWTTPYPTLLLTELALEQGNIAKAQANLDAVDALAHQLAYPMPLMALALHRSRIEIVQGDLSAAGRYLRESVTHVIQATPWRTGANWSLPHLLAGYAEILAALGYREEAARQLGAEDAMCRDMGVVRPPLRQMRYARIAAGVRDALGEKAYTVTWEAGCACSAEQSLARLEEIWG